MGLYKIMTRYQSQSSQHLSNIMKYLPFFMWVLMGVLTSSIEACNPEVRSTSNHKLDDSHEIEYEDTTTIVKPSIAEHATHVGTTVAAKPSNEAVHSTEEPTVVVAETMNRTSPVVTAEMVTSTLATVASSPSETEEPAHVTHEGVDTASTTSPVEILAIVTSMRPAAVSLTATEQPPKIAHEEVHQTSVSSAVEMTTVDDADVIQTEEPAQVGVDVTARTDTSTDTETSTRTTEELDTNKPTAAAVTTAFGIPMIVSSPSVVRRERRQADDTPIAPNTPVFGSQFASTVQTPATRKTGQHITIGPATIGPGTTIKPKPQPLATGPVSVSGRIHNRDFHE